MVTEAFGADYTGAYDAIYREKDYEAECDFLEEIFKRAPIHVRRVLDMGCGTGGHAIRLARREYEVVGVDRSKDMLEIAERKAREAGVDVKFIHGDLRELELDWSFDGVISMFAVMSYQRTNEDLAAACRTAARHLVENGVFAFDAWHGPAVLVDPPACRMKTVLDGGRRIIRFASPTLDVINHVANITFTLWVLEKERLISQTTETHVMRFLFPQEIAYFLDVAGFADISLCPFLEIDRPLDYSCWNMAVRSVKQ